MSTKSVVLNLIPHTNQYSSLVHIYLSAFIPFQNTMSGKFNERFLCPICQKHHAIRLCQKFLAMPVEKKNSFVVQNGLCVNCLALRHIDSESCPCLDRCFKCGGTHHTLLHPLSAGRVWFQLGALCRMFPEHLGLVRVMIDPNSEESYVDPEFAAKNELVPVAGRVTIFLGHRRSMGPCVVARCMLKSLRGQHNPPPKFGPQGKRKSRIAPVGCRQSLASQEHIRCYSRRQNTA